MPHSIPSDKSSSQEEEDTLLPDASSETATDATISKGSGSPSDVAMDVEEGVEARRKCADADEMDVKLQDLFNDMDEDDDEFSSSRSDAKVKMEISPPAAPM